MTQVASVATVDPDAHIATVAPVILGNNQTIVTLIDAIQALTTQVAVNTKKLDDLFKDEMTRELEKVHEKTRKAIADAEILVQQEIESARAEARQAIESARATTKDTQWHLGQVQSEVQRLNEEATKRQLEFIRVQDELADVSNILVKTQEELRPYQEAVSKDILAGYEARGGW